MINLKKLTVLGVVASSAFILSACNLYKTPTGGTGTTGQSPAASEAPAVGTVITYSDSGFSPSQITVKIGEVVTFKNDSQATVQVNSAVHPTHSQFPELNIGTIAPGESKSVTFTTSGTKKYHNHLNASQTGTIVVE